MCDERAPRLGQRHRTLEVPRSGSATTTHAAGDTSFDARRNWCSCSPFSLHGGPEFAVREMLGSCPAAANDRQCIVSPHSWGERWIPPRAILSTPDAASTAPASSCQVGCNALPMIDAAGARRMLPQLGNPPRSSRARQSPARDAVRMHWRDC